MRTHVLVAALTLAIATPAAAVAANSAGVAARSASTATPAPAPYRNPPFHCQIHYYGNGKAPNPLKTKADPLCVDYNKRDITVDNGGAVRFAEAEPARFAVAGKCEYWQQDHWRVRLDRGFGAIVRWDGSYWFDVDNGSGGAILRHFRIAGQPVGPTQAAAAIATISPSFAKQIEKYGAGPAGGGGASITLPSGLKCSTATS